MRLVALASLIVIACVPPTPGPAPVDAQAAYTRHMAADSAAVAACAVLRTEATSTSDPVFVTAEVDSAAGDPSTRGRFPTLPPRDADVLAVVVVRRDGRARSRDVHLVRATNRETGEAVVRFLRQAPFTAAQRNGQVVSQCLVVPYTMRVGQ